MKRIYLLIALVSFFAIAAESPPAPSFTIRDEQGGELRLPADQQGIGIYLFWASWCPYCRALMPHIQEMKQEYGNRVTVYALNFRDQDDPGKYIRDQGFQFIYLPDADEVASLWNVRATPGLFLVDRDGRIRFNLYDLLSEDPPGYEDMTHAQRAAHRAPFWAARIREELNELLTETLD